MANAELVIVDAAVQPQWKWRKTPTVAMAKKGTENTGLSECEMQIPMQNLR